MHEKDLIPDREIAENAAKDEERAFKANELNSNLQTVAVCLPSDSIENVTDCVDSVLEFILS